MFYVVYMDFIQPLTNSRIGEFVQKVGANGIQRCGNLDSILIWLREAEGDEGIYFVRFKVCPPIWRMRYEQQIWR